MFELFEITKILLPKLSDAQLDLLLKNDLNDYKDYDLQSWQLIKMDDLKTEKVRLSLVHTLYQSQFGYDGVYLEILRSLEKWSNRTLFFEGFSGDDLLFYNRLYVLLGYNIFPFANLGTQVFLVGSFCLPLAVIFKIDIHKQIREAFARFCQLDILEVDADIFTAALNNNNSVLARKNNGQTITVKEVLLGFLQLIDNQRNIDNYLKSLDLVASDVENVRIVLNLYNDLITNKIWLELDHSLCAHKKIEKIKVDPLAEYLKIIEETADLSGWLEDYKNVASWLADKDEKFIRNIFKILQSKINLGDQKLADNLLLLIEELHGQGRGNIEVIYYDDVSGKIKWNEEYLK